MILKAENIAKSFRRKQVLKGVTFGIERGKMIGIVGKTIRKIQSGARTIIIPFCRLTFLLFNET